jgi:predicted ATPase/transcriptional regulator with XRE-family HTH domain
VDLDSSDAAASFGELLREHRLAQGLTQEGLAERAGLSAHGILKLERSSTHPYRETAERLSRALHLTGEAEVRFHAAAQPVPRRRAGPVTAKSPLNHPVRHNLPNQTTSFIGREEDVAHVQQRLGESRLLTITGAGGCGKTRLALEIGGQIVDQYRDGVWLVDLAPLSDPSLIWRVMATMLGVREDPARAVADAVVDYLRGRSSLIILDNCEHLIDACAAAVDRLLREAASVRVLATSRELLGVPGEAAWRVRSLSVVDPEQFEPTGGVVANTLLGSEAARLLLDRTHLLNPAFHLTDENARAVARICHRLDGIPLAIELAAARLASLAVDELASRLDQRFRLLTGGYRTAVRRQQTLSATIDWSYELLSEPERALFRCLSVFAGGWSLAAAEAVGGAIAESEEDVGELLDQLVRKSMVVVDEVAGVGSAITRYRFLETIRQYAEEKLLSRGEAEPARTRHAEWYVRLAEEALDGVESADQLRWWHRLEMELDNLRAALTWLAAQPQGGEQLLHLAALLGRFWRDREHMREGTHWLETALRRVEPSALSMTDRVRALTWLGMLYMYGVDAARAKALLEEAVAQADAAVSPRLRSLLMRHLGMVCFGCNEYGRAGQLMEQALEASREAGIKREIAWNLGVIASNRIQSGGDHSSAKSQLHESIALGRESGDVVPVVYSMIILGHIYANDGSMVQARTIVDEAFTLARQIDARWMFANLHVLLGDIAAREMDWETAGAQYRQALQHTSAAANQTSMSHAVLQYAALLSARGEHRGAVRLLGALSRIGRGFDRGLSREVGPLVVNEQSVIDAARAALGDGGVAEAWAQGESMTIAQASAEILAAH